MIDVEWIEAKTSELCLFHAHTLDVQCQCEEIEEALRAAILRGRLGAIKNATALERLAAPILGGLIASVQANDDLDEEVLVGLALKIAQRLRTSAAEVL